ncbi:MAG TPA: alkaline phosphatase family protein, partial [Gaiellaceae bacterium]|nr:alkaline phosphatase family protein [Gaiellaceae bacterium]
STTGPRIPALVVSPRVNAGVFKKNLDHTSVLRFLAERFTPAKEFSPEVTARHSQRAGAALVSLGDVIDRIDARPVPPPPPVGMLPTVSFPNGRTAKTPGQQAFLDARKRLNQAAPDEMASTHPEASFPLAHH